MTKVVISQPMLFPWVGMFEQIRLADVYVHYDDVDFSKGSFVNRVQIKTGEDSIKWLTLPLANRKLGTEIRNVQLDSSKDWRSSHLAFLEQVYRKAPYVDDMLGIVASVYSGAPGENMMQVVVASLEAVCDYFDFSRGRRFLYSSGLGIEGQSSQRVLDIVRRLEGSVYITGHGAKRYLDHDLFERHDIRVEYMAYDRRPYPQLYGAFNPHVSVLDLIANTGKAGAEYIASGTQYWREALA